MQTFPPVVNVKNDRIKRLGCDAIAEKVIDADIEILKG